MTDTSREAVERLIYIYEVEVDAADFAEVDSSTDKQVVATLRAQVDEIERLKAERDVLRDREKHFASVLSVADRGQYRNDWDAAIRRVLAERDALREAVTQILTLDRGVAPEVRDADAALDAWWSNLCAQYREIARAALNRQPDT